MNSQQLLPIALHPIHNKKTQHTISLQMKPISHITHYFLLTHPNNQPQLQPIPTPLKQLPNQQNIQLKPIQPYNQPPCILIHLPHLLLHLFHKHQTNYYNIQKLYQDPPLQSYPQVAY
ncbi:RsfS/YbeB/iojap family protein [Staphylococcus aureus]|uniref:RsfS/YbeB/iojap family protein n=1 Tax=Staphylococcus aureus TaxID=1280 RepID=UPI00119E8C90